MSTHVTRLSSLDAKTGGSRDCAPLRPYLDVVGFTSIHMFGVY